jgi:thiosulfate reductase cytochrome b subunit
MKVLEKKHPLAIRWFHWINFPVLMIMIWSGVLIYWANDVYHIGPIHFFPNWFYQRFNLGQRLADGMAWHFFFAWFFTINGIAYVLYTAFSGEWRHLLPNKNTFKEAWQVMLHDLFLSKKHPPRRKFNGAQQLAYTAVIVMGAGSLITGLAVFRPIQFAWIAALCGGYSMARLIHFVLTIGYCLFFMIHIVQVIRAGWNNFRAMVTGVEVVKATYEPFVAGRGEAVVSGTPAAAATEVPSR